MGEVAEEAIDRRIVFARAFGRGVIEWEAEDFTEQALTLPFGLSAWMRQCGIEPEEACAAMWLLRETLMEVSGLQRASEPRPLMPADRRTALMNMAIYLDSLVGRASRTAGTGRLEILEAAVSTLH